MTNAVVSSRRKRRLQSRWLPVIFLLPAVTIFIVLRAAPLFDAVLLSLQSWDGMSEARWVGTRNYVNLLDDRIFLLSLGNTFYFVIATVIFQTTIPLLVANLLNSGVRGSTIFRAIYFLPVIISLTISGMLWSIIFEPNFGFLNEFLRLVGLDEWTQLWLADKSLVMPSIIFVSIWQSLGFFLVIFFAGLQNIPAELYEAASIDGANAWHRLRHVTVPLLRPVITVVVVLNTIGGVQAFDQIWVMTAGGPNHASETMATYLYTIAFGAMGSANPQLGYAAAIGMVILVIGFILSMIQIRWSQAGETEY